MTQITIPDIPPEVLYSVSSPTAGIFTVPFPFFNQADVHARVTDIAGVVTELVYLTDFTFNFATTPPGQEGNGFSGGGITLNVAVGADGDTELLIYRDQAIDRTSVFPNSGPFAMPLLNDEQNSFIMMLQQVATNFWQMLAGTTARPSINIPEGVAPVKPLDGDIWLTSTDFLARVNGVSYSLIEAALLSGDVSKVGSPVNDQVGVWTGDGTLEGTSNLNYDSVLNQLRVEGFFPRLMLSESGASADEGKWRLEADGDSFSLRAVNDAESVTQTVLSVARTGSTPDNISLFTKLTAIASNAARTGFNIPEGVAPSSPNDGDVWVTAAGQFLARLNGATVDLSAVGAGDVTKVGTPINGEIAYWTGDGTLGRDPSWTWDAVNNFQIINTAGGAWVGYDNVSLKLGTGVDLDMFSDGLDVYMNLGVGSDLLIRGGTSGTDNVLYYQTNSVLNLYFNNLLRFQTGNGGTWHYGSIFQLEKAAAEAPSATWGQTWVKSSAPNELWFTDDTGVDHQLTGPEVEIQNKVKDANETLNNSNVLQDDDALAGFVLQADKRYKFKVFLQVTAVDALSDLAVDLTFSQAPQSGSKVITYYNIGVQNSSASLAISGGQFAAIDIAGANLVEIEGIFQSNVSTGGIVDLQWAQSIARAFDTIVWEGSYMTVEQLD